MLNILQLLLCQHNFTIKAYYESFNVSKNIIRIAWVWFERKQKILPSLVFGRPSPPQPLNDRF